MALTRVVLDASAALALLKAETGGEVVSRLGEDALISSVNLAEVVAKLIDHGQPPEAAEAVASVLPFDVVIFDGPMALRAGKLRAAARSRGLSLGDRACLALAQREGLPALTADRAWAGLDIGVEVRLIR